MRKNKAMHKARRYTRSYARERSSRYGTDQAYLVVVRSWMLIVVFALMVGIGAIVGTYLNIQLNEGTPQVAGAAEEMR